MSSLLAPIANYCERTELGLLSEPVNFFSNAAFFIAAALLYRCYKTNARRDREGAALIVLIATVGVGSSLFHSFANRLSMLADVIPIMVFVCYFLWVALHRFLSLKHTQSATALALFVAFSILLGKVPHAYSFNGSAAYFSCLATLFLIALHLRKRHHPAAASFIKAGLWFTISLTFRSIDLAICPWWPVGVHFIWHLCNGVVLYILTRAILTTPASRAD